MNTQRKFFGIGAVLLGLLLALSGCGSDSNDGDSTTSSCGSFTSTDTFAFEINGGTEASFTETPNASSPYCADPLVHAAYQTSDSELEIVFAETFTGDVLAQFIRLTLGSTADGTYTIGNPSVSAYYFTDFDSSDDTFSTWTSWDLASSGTITIANAGTVGDTITGSFSFPTMVNGGGTTVATSMTSTGFSIVRGDDE